MLMTSSTLDYLPQLKLEDETSRQLKLLRLFCRIYLAIAVVSLPLSLLRAFDSSSNWLTLPISISSIILTVLSYFLVGKSKLTLGAWLFVGGISFSIAFNYALSGTSTLLMIYFLLPIAIGCILLSMRSVVILSGSCILFTLSLYFVQNFAQWYNPGVTNTTQVTEGLFITLVLIPAMVALILIPARWQQRSLAQQNQRLLKALQELEARQQTSEKVSSDVLGLAATLRSNASQQTDGSEQQASAITQVSNSLSELTETAAHIADSTRQVAQAAGQMVNGAGQVATIATQAVQATDASRTATTQSLAISQQIGLRYQSLNESLGTLAQRADNIRTILTLIDSIVGETHILALNAAIEAAGAGEYGDRFGVVAQEVKQLAIRTREAGDEVKQLVDQIGDGVTQAVKSAESGNQLALEVLTVAQNNNALSGKLVAVVEEAVQETNQIVLQANLVLQLSQEIELATHQQQRAGEQVLQTLKQVEQVAQTSVSGSQEVTVTAYQLEEATTSLKASLAYSLN